MLKTEYDSKICKDCGKELPLHQFGNLKNSKDGKRNICKNCKNKKEKIRRGLTPRFNCIENPNIIINCIRCGKEYPFSSQYFYYRNKEKKTLRRHCKKCSCLELNKEKIKEYYIKNREKIIKRVKEYSEKNKEIFKIKHKQYREKNKDRELLKSKEYYKKNKEKVIAKNKEYRQNNQEKIRLYKRKYISDKRNNDINYKIKMQLRKRVNGFIKNRNKKNYYMELLQTDYKSFKNYMELKFVGEMSWDNYGKNGWHIDHIIPCSSFDLTDVEEQKKCFHYTNLQPLWAEDNINKSDNIVNDRIWTENGWIDNINIGDQKCLNMQ